MPPFFFVRNLVGLEADLPLPHQTLVATVCTGPRAVGQADGVLCRQGEVEPGLKVEAIAVQRGAGDGEAVNQPRQGAVGLADLAVDSAVEVFPAGAEVGGEADLVIEPIHRCQAQAQGGAEVLLGLCADVQRGQATRFLETVAVVALETEAGEGFDAEVRAAQLIAQFGKQGLALGVVFALSCSL